MDPNGLSQTATNVAVGALVLTLTQSTKRFTPEGWGPIVAAVWTTLALGVWLGSQVEWPPARTSSFEILAVWVSVYATALGLYSASMVPSSSRQSIGTGDGRAVDGNTPVGETAPTNAPAAKARPSRAKPAVPLTEPVVAMPTPRRSRAQPTVEADPIDPERVRVVPAGRG